MASHNLAILSDAPPDRAAPYVEIHRSSELRRLSEKSLFNPTKLRPLSRVRRPHSRPAKHFCRQISTVSFSVDGFVGTYSSYTNISAKSELCVELGLFPVLFTFLCFMGLYLENTQSVLCAIGLARRQTPQQYIDSRNESSFTKNNFNVYTLKNDFPFYKASRFQLQS